MPAKKSTLDRVKKAAGVAAIGAGTIGAGLLLSRLGPAGRPIGNAARKAITSNATRKAITSIVAPRMKASLGKVTHLPKTLSDVAKMAPKSASMGNFITRVSDYVRRALPSAANKGSKSSLTQWQQYNQKMLGRPSHPSQARVLALKKEILAMKPRVSKETFLSKLRRKHNIPR